MEKTRKKGKSWMLDGETKPYYGRKKPKTAPKSLPSVSKSKSRKKKQPRSSAKASKQPDR